MYIKLAFTTNTALTAAFRLVDGIIKTGSVTSTNTLITNLLPAFSGSIKDRLDTTNTVVVRTDDPVGVNSHFYFANTPSQYYHKWTLEFPVQDDPGNKYYYQLNMRDQGQNTYIQVGDSYSISGTGTWANSVPYSSNNDYSTNINGYNSSNIVLGNVVPYNVNAVPYTPTYGLQCYTFHCYISNTSFVWASSGQPSSSGFPGSSSYSAANNYIGPFYCTQYTRYDSWNNANNGVIPVVYNIPYFNSGINAAIGKGMPNYGAWNSTISAEALDKSYSSLLAHSTYDARWTNNPSFPKIYNTGVEYSKAPFSWSNYNSAYTDAILASGVSTGITTRQAYTTVNGWRFPNATNTGESAGLFPVKWRHSVYYNQGGNITDKAKIYWYSGTYTPGDVFSYNNTVYSIWPSWEGPNYYCGVAVPRQ